MRTVDSERRGFRDFHQRAIYSPESHSRNLLLELRLGRTPQPRNIYLESSWKYITFSRCPCPTTGTDFVAICHKEEHLIRGKLLLQNPLYLASYCRDLPEKPHISIASLTLQLVRILLQSDQEKLNSLREISYYNMTDVRNCEMGETVTSVSWNFVCCHVFTELYWTKDLTNVGCQNFV